MIVSALWKLSSVSLDELYSETLDNIEAIEKYGYMDSYDYEELVRDLYEIADEYHSRQREFPYPMPDHI